MTTSTATGKVIVECEIGNVIGRARESELEIAVANQPQGDMLLDYFRFNAIIPIQKGDRVKAYFINEDELMRGPRHAYKIEKVDEKGNIVATYYD